MGVEDDCVCSNPKIFVGQIPSNVSRQSLFRVFEPFGTVHKIDMLTPRQPSLGTRSAMVWLTTWTEVECILEAVAGDQIDVGGPKKLVVRIADPPKKGDNCLGIKPRKLFIGQIPKEVTELEVKDAFEQFGIIEEFEMPKRSCVVSCAFVRYSRWSEAELAIATMNEKFRFPESKRALVVKFADAKNPDATKSTSIGEKRPLTPEDRVDFIRRHCSSFRDVGGQNADPLDMGYLDSRMGQPMGVGSLTGMGRIECSPLFKVKIPISVGQIGIAGQGIDEGGLGVNVYSESAGSSGTFQSLASGFLSVGEIIPTSQFFVEDSMVADFSASVLPPVGPNGKLGRGFSDPKVKEWTLFIGQIPHQADEYMLWDLFRPYGDILELNILRREGKHRGCAFVTYESRQNAFAAIEKLNGVSFPWDVNQRRLVVKFRERT